MTRDELEELLADCPTLYHMAELGSWPSIRAHGLRSTSALLDLYGIKGEERRSIEQHRRSASIAIRAPGLPGAVVRDQKPMHERALSRCLQDGLAPSDWYQILNRRVFFWLTRARLFGLLKAASYRTAEHDVLHIDARALVFACKDNITLSPINSGNTQRFATPRGLATFTTIAEYQYSHWRSRRRRGERVVELAVEHAVPNIAEFVRRVVRMQGDSEREVLYPPTSPS